MKKWKITICDKCGNVIGSGFGNYCVDCSNNNCRDIIVVEKHQEMVKGESK